MVDELIRPSVARYADAPAEARGKIFTKPEVPGFVLDLMEWGLKPFSAADRLLEPSCGGGDFFLSALVRLLSGIEDRSFDNLRHRLLGVEINREAFDRLRVRVEEPLERYGFSKRLTVYRLLHPGRGREKIQVPP